MPVGTSGRIVIEIDPELKQELYQHLYQQDVKLKDWFLVNVKELLADKSQLSLCFDNAKNKSYKMLEKGQKNDL